MKESSEVLARKYRPKNFDELVGQESIAQTLSLALDNNRLSHAYLFSGLRGSGKTSTARIFAKALICEEGITHKPCEKCQNCIMSSENRHVDIIEMDGASNRGIDDIRELVEQTKYKPAIARFKIFIIDEVHMLTTQAFNALLKTLEEPPSYVKFILATTDPLKLPATILSRTQHFRFKSIAINKIINHLAHILNIENIGYENSALEILARSGGGSLRDTLTLLDQAIIYSKNHVDVRTVTDMLGLVDPKFIAKLFDAVFEKDYAKLIEYVKILDDYEPEMVTDELIAYLKEKMYNHDAMFSTLVLDRFFRILSDSKYLFSINADGSFVLSMIFFKMIEALQIKEIDQMIESLQKEIQKPEKIKTKSITQKEELQKEELQKEELQKEELQKEELQKEELQKEELQKEEPKEHTKVSAEQTHMPNPHAKMFNELTIKIKDRNYELGKCFAENIEFVSYKDGVLTWESCADEECKKNLRHGFGVIKQFVKEVFGLDTQIKMTPCSKPINKKDDTPKQQNEMQTASMIEDTETKTGSCIENCNTQNKQPKEINGADILKEPIVQKATELFEATKRTVLCKV